MSELEITDYSEKAIAVYGNTKPYKSSLLDLGGKFNGALKGGAGWIFPKIKKAKVQELLDQINNGDVSEEEVKESNNDKNPEKGADKGKKESGEKSKPTESLDKRYVPYKTYLDLLTRVEKLEA